MPYFVECAGSPVSLLPELPAAPLVPLPELLGLELEPMWLEESRDEPVPLDEVSLDEPVPPIEPLDVLAELLLLFFLLFLLFFLAPLDSFAPEVPLMLEPPEPPPGLVAPEVSDDPPLAPALPPWANAGPDASRNIDATNTLSLRISNPLPS